MTTGSNLICVLNLINGIAGVVTVGLFARRGASVVLVGSSAGVKTLVAGS